MRRTKYMRTRSRKMYARAFLLLPRVTRLSLRPPLLSSRAPDYPSVLSRFGRFVGAAIYGQAERDGNRGALYVLTLSLSLSLTIVYFHAGISSYLFHWVSVTALHCRCCTSGSLSLSLSVSLSRAREITFDGKIARESRYVIALVKLPRREDVSRARGGSDSSDDGLFMGFCPAVGLFRSRFHARFEKGTRTK